jgi:uncharacterized protein
MKDRQLLRLDLHALGRHPGEMVTRHIEVPAPDDLAAGLIGVVPASPRVIDVTCQSVGDGVLVRGTVAADLEGQCARCLGRVKRPGTFDVLELYYYIGRGPAPGADDEEEALFVEDESVDLDPVVREAIVCALPFSPLCREDCAGLCPVCGTDLNLSPGHSCETGSSLPSVLVTPKLS